MQKPLDILLEDQKTSKYITSSTITKEKNPFDSRAQVSLLNDSIIGFLIDEYIHHSELYSLIFEAELKGAIMNVDEFVALNNGDIIKTSDLWSIICSSIVKSQKNHIILKCKEGVDSFLVLDLDKIVSNDRLDFYRMNRMIQQVFVSLKDEGEKNVEHKWKIKNIGKLIKRQIDNGSLSPLSRFKIIETISNVVEQINDTFRVFSSITNLKYSLALDVLSLSDALGRERMNKLQFFIYSSLGQKTPIVPPLTFIKKGVQKSGSYDDLHRIFEFSLKNNAEEIIIL